MTGCPFIAGTPIGRVFRRQMKGRKKQPAFIAEPFKIKRISESRHANKQIIINVLSLIYDRYERFIFFRLCNNNPPSLSILRIHCCFIQMKMRFRIASSSSLSGPIILFSFFFIQFYHCILRYKRNDFMNSKFTSFLKHPFELILFDQSTT